MTDDWKFSLTLNIAVDDSRVVDPVWLSLDELDGLALRLVRLSISTGCNIKTMICGTTVIVTPEDTVREISDKIAEIYNSQKKGRR